eukprot:GHVO01018601.1.p1 GENE.GHVO01018601.1~~GHVO01018601.1.p1  ORF type:complete len:155 (-),score=13.38 GHVO01018601.1:313-777(-)
MMKNNTPRTHMSLLKPAVTRDMVQTAQADMKDRYDVSTKGRTFSPGEDVFTRRKGRGSPWNIATVLQQNGQDVSLELEDGRMERRHLDDVKVRRSADETVDEESIDVDVPQSSTQPTGLVTPNTSSSAIADSPRITEEPRCSLRSRKPVDKLNL